jgi:hypothetical protein
VADVLEAKWCIDRSRAVGELTAEAGPGVDYRGRWIELADRRTQGADQLIERRCIHARRMAGTPHCHRALLARAYMPALSVFGGNGADHILGEAGADQ